jgi:hypothetical protein
LLVKIYGPALAVVIWSIQTANNGSRSACSQEVDPVGLGVDVVRKQPFVSNIREKLKSWYRIGAIVRFDSDTNFDLHNLGMSYRRHIASK